MDPTTIARVLIAINILMFLGLSLAYTINPYASYATTETNKSSVSAVTIHHGIVCGRLAFILITFLLEITRVKAYTFSVCALVIGFRLIYLYFATYRLHYLVQAVIDFVCCFSVLLSGISDKETIKIRMVIPSVLKVLFAVDLLMSLFFGIGYLFFPGIIMRFLGADCSSTAVMNVTTTIGMRGLVSSVLLYATSTKHYQKVGLLFAAMHLTSFLLLLQATIRFYDARSIGMLLSLLYHGICGVVIAKDSALVRAVLAD